MKTDFDVKAGIQGIVDYLKKDESLKKDDYYSEGMNEADARTTQAIWAGSLAPGLGLEGRADEEMFSQLQDGYLPDGKRMRGKNQTGEEILLHDMTLSAPKSVTLHALEDTRLFDAHITACKKTIAAAEQHYAVYLQGEDRHAVLGQGIVAAIIPHWTNRNMEPQLHSHCAIFNGTMTEDGRWRSIHMHPLSRERWMGSYYRNALAQEVQEIGYKIHETPMANGAWGFEIDGLTREQIEAFSSRTAEIEAAKAKGMDGNAATLKTRKKKGAQPSWQELRESTREARAELGAELQAPSLDTQAIGKMNSDAAVASAIADLSERLARFKRADIYQRTFNHIEGFSLEQIDAAIARNPQLLDYGVIKNDPKLEGQLTTVSALEREVRTLNRWFEGQGKASPILDRATALQRIDDIYRDSDQSLNTGQLEAVLGILSCTDQHQILHGLSGVGKTRTMKPLRTIAESEGVKIKWFAPSLDAAQKLSDEIGAPAETLQSLVFSNYRLNKGDLLIIDEAGLASAEMADILVQKANSAGARILLVGDTGQNQPIDAGAPVRSLMDAGATTHRVSEILRQKDQIQRQAVMLASKGNGTDALNLLNQHGYVEEIAERTARANAISTAYLELSPEERAKTLIVAGTHAEKDGIVEQIRAGLKAEGSLGESVTATQLRDRGWTKEHGMDIRNYQVGDYIAMSKALKKCPLIKDEFYKIVERNHETLTVESGTGKRYPFDPNQYAEKRVFYARNFDIAVGDELRWQHTNNRKGRKNGQTFRVVNIEGAIATIESGDKTRRLDLNSPLAVDYTITTTNYRAQGSDRPRVFIAATDDPTSNKEAFYVGISRQIHELKIWTSNLAGLQRRVAMSSAQSNPLQDIKNDKYIDRIAYRSKIKTGTRNSGYEHYWTFGRASHPSQSEQDFSRKLRPDYFDGYRRAVKQTAGGREQDPRGYRVDSEHTRRHGSISRAEQSAARRTERPHRSTDRRNYSGETVAAGSTSATERLQDQIIDLVYQRRLSEALAEPLAKLAQSLAALEKAQEENRKLMRDHAIAQAEAKAVAIALKEWQENPQQTRAEPYISYVLDAVQGAIPPRTEQVFWMPAQTEAIGDISPQHWKEFQNSCIHPDILALNAKSLSGQEVYDRLLSHKLEFMGSGQLITAPQQWLINRYAGVARGGWFARGGVNPQKMSEPQEWGTFKPNLARMGSGKRIKYESPLGIPRGVFLPYVPEAIAEAIYKKYGIEPTLEDLQRGFWAIVRDYNLPIVITEGAKKTWASLSQGYPTIGLSGVNGMYLTKDVDGKLNDRKLNPDIAVFATPGREITIAFDQDTKPKTIENVRRDLVRGVELLTDAGCNCKIAKWNPDAKGLDDLIAKYGSKVFTDALAEAELPDDTLRQHYVAQYERIAKKAKAAFPRETQEFIDTEVWLRAMARGDQRDGMRFVRAGAAARGIDPDAYCKELLSNGSTIRKLVVIPDRVIIDFAHGLLMKGEQRPNGDRIYSQGVWFFHSRGQDLTIRCSNGGISYQTKNGLVCNNFDGLTLKALAQNIAALQRSSEPQRRARR